MQITQMSMRKGRSRNQDARAILMIFFRQASRTFLAGFKNISTEIRPAIQYIDADSLAQI
jgi:hypothetical protein